MDSEQKGNSNPASNEESRPLSIPSYSPAFQMGVLILGRHTLILEKADGDGGGWLEVGRTEDSKWTSTTEGGEPLIVAHTSGTIDVNYGRLLVRVLANFDIESVRVVPPLDLPFRNLKKGQGAIQEHCFDSKGLPSLGLLILFALRTGRTEDRWLAINRQPDHDELSPYKTPVRYYSDAQNTEAFEAWAGREIVKLFKEESGRFLGCCSEAADRAIEEHKDQSAARESTTYHADWLAFQANLEAVTRDGNGLPTKTQASKFWDECKNHRLGEWKSKAKRFGFDWLPTDRDFKDADFPNCMRRHLVFANLLCNFHPVEFEEVPISFVQFFQEAGLLNKKALAAALLVMTTKSWDSNQGQQ